MNYINDAIQALLILALAEGDTFLIDVAEKAESEHARVKKQQEQIEALKKALKDTTRIMIALLKLIPYGQSPVAAGYPRQLAEWNQNLIDGKETKS